MSEVCTGLGEQGGNKIEKKGMEQKESDKKGARV